MAAPILLEKKENSKLFIIILFLILVLLIYLWQYFWADMLMEALEAAVEDDGVLDVFLEKGFDDEEGHVEEAGGVDDVHGAEPQRETVLKKNRKQSTSDSDIYLQMQKFGVQNITFLIIIKYLAIYLINGSGKMNDPGFPDLSKLKNFPSIWRLQTFQ